MLANSDVLPTSGAMTDEVRDHFRSWVKGDVRARLRSGSTLDPESASDWSRWMNVIEWTPRYNYCLYEDEICLESLDHYLSPVVKMICLD